MATRRRSMRDGAAVDASTVASSPALTSRRMRRRSARAACCVAWPETKVWRDAEVLPASRGAMRYRRVTSVDPVEADAERIGADLREHGVRALADVDRALVEHDAAVGRRGRRASSTGWRARCCRSRTTCRRCRRRVAPGRPRCRRCARARPRGRRASAAAAPRRQATMPTLASSTWPVAVAVAGAQRVARCGTPAGRCRGGRPARRSALSVAIAACGVPKPRKAPAGGLLV